MTQTPGDDGHFGVPDGRDDRGSTAAAVLGTFGALLVAGVMTVAVVFAFGEDDDDPTVMPQPAATETALASSPSPQDATTVPASPSATPSPTSTPTVMPESTAFVSPSGNIACMVAAERAECQINAYDYDPPDWGECPSDATWGDWVEVTAAGSAWTCHDDRTLAGSDVLSYGDEITVGDFSCESARSGVTCRHDPSDASFSVARAGVDLS